MFEIRRLMAVGAFLALGAVITCSHVWGEPGSKQDRELKKWRVGGPSTKRDRMEYRFSEEVAASRFQEEPVALYESARGESYFSLQLKPDLEDAPDRPRDYLVLLDTSASKAQGPLALGQKIVSVMAEKLRPQDRMSLWTANTRPKSISRGFRTQDGLKAALEEVNKEYPSGATNLRQALEEAITSFGPDDPQRQRVIVFLGDGVSIAGPIDADARARLSGDMVKNRIAFFSVPLGSRFDPENLHGFVNATGGKCVRVDGTEPIDTFVPRFLQAVAEPILYPTAHKWGADSRVTQAYPTRLPPLRRDMPTLIVGQIEPGKSVSCSVSGAVAGREVEVEYRAALPAPEVDNFFLLHMVSQWREQKDQPALLQADRALAFAFEQHQLARADLLAKADWALEQDQLEPAMQLFLQAAQLDPACKEARVGQQIVQALREGKTREQLREEFKPRAGDQLVRIDGDGALEKVGREHFVQAQDPAPPPPPRPDADIIQDVKARQAIADQMTTQMVNDAIRDADRLVRVAPDDARDLLKRTLESVRNNPDITARTKTALSLRLEQSLQRTDLVGAQVRRDQEENLKLRAIADALALKENVQTAAQERIRERMRVFHALMNQAREQEAYRQAQAIREDLVSEGQPVPPAVTAGYEIALSGYHLRELRNLRRIRQERWLAVMLSVEKSHIPFPDEPPVEYPSAAVIRTITRGTYDNWIDWSKDRQARYETSGLGTNLPKRAYELQDILSKPVSFQGFEDPKTTLTEALDQLAKRYDLTFDVNERAFKFENVMDVLKTEIAQPNPIPPMTTSLGTVLKKILARVPAPSGATYLIRRDVVEITTTQFATAEKTIRVYPVADLVVPILPDGATPGSFLFGQSGNSLFGFQGGGAMQLGGLGVGLQLGAAGGLQLGALGALGGGGLALGALGGGGLALGGLGALGGGGLALGGLGAVGAVGNIGALGNIGAAGGFGQIGQGGFQGQFMGQSPLGLIGGIASGTGGQEQNLITLITQVVGRPSDWAPRFDPTTGQPLDPLNMGADPAIQGGDDNQLAFYSPAMALVVKGTSRIHSRAESPISAGGPMDLGGGLGFPGMGALDKPRRDGLVRIDGKNDPKVQVAGNGDRIPNDPQKDPKKGPPADPEKVWQDALAKGKTNPGMVIAVADYLALNRRWEHASEFLKAALRQGVVVQPWVYESLAIALRESGASPEEIERAEVSVADLAPMDAQGMLKASQAMASQKRYDRAVAFCQQAAQLEPNLSRPYTEALLYAELARDPQAMEWAAGSLLKKDWPAENKKLHARAMQKLESLARTLETENREKEGKALLAAARDQGQRDLVIKLAYQGQADLDLKVHEPSGSVCSTLSRQTVGGGVLVGDSVIDLSKETYMAAEALSGTYRVTVERVWGRPLGDRAQLRIIRHQGTEREIEELITVDLGALKPVVIQLEGGRRTELAYVPPPELQKPEPTSAEKAGHRSDSVLGQLRALADPEVTGFDRGAIRGGSVAGGIPTPSAKPVRVEEKPSSPHVVFQNRIRPFVEGSVEMVSQAELAADRRSVRLSLRPVFNTVTGVTGRPMVRNPIIPGGR